MAGKLKYLIANLLLQLADQWGNYENIRASDGSNERNWFKVNIRNECFIMHY